MVKYENRKFNISSKANKFVKTLPKNKREKIKMPVECLMNNDTEQLNIKRLLPHPKEFRVAISNNRIKIIDNGVIKFLYKNRKKKKWKIMALDAMAFIRRFLQHFLPKGFIKIRHYDFLNPNSALPIEKIRELISFIHDIIAFFTNGHEADLDFAHNKIWVKNAQPRGY